MTFLGVSTEAIFPVITLIVGAFLKGIFDLLAEKRADRRAQENRTHQRRDTILLKRLEFQQATLLEFQEVTSRLVRFLGSAYYQDEMSFRETGKWRRSFLSEEVNQGLAAEQARFALISVRVRDETAREIAASFSDAAVAGLMAKSQDDALATIVTMTDRLNELNERIGTLLRELEASEDDIAGTSR